MISTGELKKGVAIELDGELWQILDYHHIKMGRGSAQVRITLRNIKRGQTVERSFQAGTKWPRASMEKRPVQFLYRDGDDFHFMDTDTYDQFMLTAEQLGETAQYLKDGMTHRPDELPGRDDRRRAAGDRRPRGRRDRAGLRRRHAVRRAQARDDRDRARRPGADLRRARRHHPHRHADRGVPDPGLIGPRSRRPPDVRALPIRDASPDGPPASPSDARPPARRARSASASSASARSPAPSATAVRQDPRLVDLWVEGEIGRVTVSSAGHAYFALKDERNQLQCVWFRDDRQRSAFEAQAGLRVVAHGRIDLYEPNGALQLYVDSIQPAGFGDLALRFEALKARLAAEGLFDAARKRPLPVAAHDDRGRHSPTGAVWRDICHVLARRWPLVRVVLVAARVQGDERPGQPRHGASAGVERWVDAVPRRGPARPTRRRVTILARGGGSLEDLWAFNDERVVRAVVAHPVPVVAGVGHEVDVTLADFAADVRAPTPSAAAEIVVPDRVELVARPARRAAAARRRGRPAGRRRCREVAAERRALDRLHPAAQLAAARERAGLLLDRATRAVRPAGWRPARRRDGSAARLARPADATGRGPRCGSARRRRSSRRAGRPTRWPRARRRDARPTRRRPRWPSSGPQATLDRGYAIVRRAAMTADRARPGRGAAGTAAPHPGRAAASCRPPRTSADRRRARERAESVVLSWHRRARRRGRGRRWVCWSPGGSMAARGRR